MQGIRNQLHPVSPECRVSDQCLRNGAGSMQELLGVEPVVSREYVYAHAQELGGQRLGSGSRGRWRFPPSVEVVEPPSIGITEPKPKTIKRRLRNGNRVKLLEVPGSAAMLSDTKAALGGAITPTEGLDIGGGSSNARARS